MHTPTCSTRTRGTSARPARCRCSTSRRRASAPRSRPRRRSASRSVTTAAPTSRSVKRALDVYGVPYVIDSTLVRGLDYYSRTTFEFVGPDENANSTICGGGRYDGLVEAIGGPPTPGIGFGAGLERLLLALENEGIAVSTDAPRRLHRRRRRRRSRRGSPGRGRVAPARRLDRPRLCRQVVQGPDDTGRPYRRARRLRSSAPTA